VKLLLVAALVTGACPFALYPQHSTTLSLRNAQVCDPPALTCVKPPIIADLVAGACPEVLSPQHSATPSLRDAQA
jgi:hypothetical protein